ncbi:hypothetical protein [Brevundimonas subvibrioides]|uniref:Uncharacterized protein n=1 Tax=Brevundimonas subvibrioides (strain ATCC 15264 / DSM 4735 / LMG 14903 / NBRC 16000 / CB 81) TaxID=633149 RepID=D9QHU4_BRESC|nr:hypothetical protein [Brevundimonas subvibrioides]ADK99369.1 hypothetical protein Bresu_0054 [Brevundimonas subvibrioides ATCC 15264]
MTPGDWQRFLQSGQRSERPIGRISAYLNGYLEASDRQVRVGHEYVRKAIEKHGLTIEHLPVMAEALAAGEVYHDRGRDLTFVHFSAEHQRWFQLTIKCCTERRRLYVKTFHGLAIGDVLRKRKLYQVVWPIPGQ